MPNLLKARVLIVPVVEQNNHAYFSITLMPYKQSDFRWRYYIPAVSQSVLFRISYLRTAGESVGMSSSCNSTSGPGGGKPSIGGCLGPGGRPRPRARPRGVLGVTGGCCTPRGVIGVVGCCMRLGAIGTGC